jgi:tetratricopeptide (TPR) repeat protein
MALRLDEENHVLLSNRSAAFMGMGQWQAAFEDARFVCELAPQWAKGYSRMGAALSALGKYADSVQAYRMGVQLEPQNEQMRESLREAEKMLATGNGGARAAGSREAGRSAADRQTHEPPKPKKTRQHEECAVPTDVGKKWIHAARHGDVEALSGLLRGGNAAALLQYAGQGTSYSFLGHTAMHWCAARGHVTCLELLIGARADVNVKNRGGSTPLHAAAQRDVLESARLLLASGANLQARDLQGLTPQQVAHRLGSTSVLDYLSQASGAEEPAQAASHQGCDKTSAAANGGTAAQKGDESSGSPAEAAAASAAESNESALEELRAQGNKKFAQHEYVQAVELYTQALSLDPRNHVVLSNRSAALLALKEIRRALDDASACVSMVPDWAKGHLRMGAAYLADGELYNAVLAYRLRALYFPTLAHIFCLWRSLTFTFEPSPHDNLQVCGSSSQL